MTAEKNPKIMNMPNWVWLVVIVAALGVLVVYAPTTPPADNALDNLPSVTEDNSLTHGATLPATVGVFTVTPAQPKAGENISFSVEIKDPYATTWQDLFSFELWVRQFGNWQKTSCYDSPCVYTLNDASQGDVEYKIVRTANDGSVSEEESYFVKVESTITTGDTLGPKVTVYHTPQNPKESQSVSIVVLANDISGLERVDIYHNGEILRTCPQKVKISQCQAAVSSLEVGQHTYYAYAIDSFGNETTTAELTFTVSTT